MQYPDREKQSDLTDLEQQTLALYERGRYLSAYHLLESHGGLGTLTGPTGRALAGRVAGNLGAERYGAAIHLRAWRKAPDANVLGFYVGMHLGRFWGPLRGLEFLNRLQTEELTPLGRSDVASAKAYLLSVIRDFSRAEAVLDEGIAATPDRPWLLVTRGYLLSAQDHPDQALASYQEALELRPYYRPAVQSAAGELIQHNRVDEARSLLVDAGKHLECGAIHLQLAQLEREVSNYQSAQQQLAVAMKLLPLHDHDRDSVNPYIGFEATLAYDVGGIDDAIRLSKKSGLPFFETVAKNLEKNRSTGRRVMLDVGFTLQRDMTCVPATLSTLTKYWQQPVEQIDIAAAICYDGTPAHAEREWLEGKGFFCREFTLTWEIAQKLIDAGLPFAQTLTGYDVGHMQAIIGYDSCRGVLIYRDPNVRHAGEVLGKELIDKMQSTGPRGMVFVPKSQRELVEQFDLPDHELWTLCHQVSVCLADHRREDAVAACKKLRVHGQKHRLALHAIGRLAAYDGDLRKLLKVTNKLLEQFPDDQNQWSTKLRLLQQIGTRDERLLVLEELCKKSDCAMVYQHQLLEELLDDPRERVRVDRLLRRCLKANPVDEKTYTMAARREWANGRREKSLEWYRAAACLETRAENPAMTYFSAARALNKTDEALCMLRDRFDRFRSQDSGPGRSLAESLDQLLQSQSAGEVLRSALVARPEDGDLLLFASNFLMRLGRMSKAKDLLRQARGKCHEADWLSAAARLAQMGNRFDDAYSLLQETLKRAPLNLGAHRHAVEVLADARGAAAAANHLKEYVDRFPKNLELRALFIEALSEVGPEEAEVEARIHLKLHPHDAWCWRELGFKLSEQRRWKEAHQVAAKAHELEPLAMQNFLLLGIIFAGVGKNDLARKYLHKALKISTDNMHVINELMKLCESQQERREALMKVLSQYEEQVIHGESLHLFRDYASRAFEPQDALKILEQAREARPDLWQSWSVVVRQLLATKDSDRALKLARAAAKRFPLLPDTLIDLADVYLELGQPEAERDTLDRALAIDSRYGQTLRRSAEAYQRSGDVEHARQALERACQSEPRNMTHQGALAEMLWQLGERDQAIARISDAIDREPRYDWAWGKLTDWSNVIHDPDLVIKMAAKITETRPESPEMWGRRAEVLATFPERSQDSLFAFDQALKLNPRDVGAYDQRAILLAYHGEFEKALAGCRPQVFLKNPPLQLRARAAVIEYQRGEQARAIKLMQKVVAEDSHHAFAWSQLSSWHQQDENHDEALRCAKKLLDTAPEAPASWGYVADCYLVVGNKDQAAKHLQRSIELDSSYLYGGQNLLALQTESGEYDEALKTLNLFGPHITDHDRSALEAKLYGLANRADQSLAAFRKACIAATDAVDFLWETTECLLQIGWAEPVKGLIQEEIDAQRANPQAVGTLVEILAREAELESIEQLCNNLDPDTAQWAEAAAVLLEALGDAQEHDKIDAFVARWEVHLRQQSRSWGLVGSAMQASGREQKAIQWMADWRQRDDIEPYQFVPLLLSLLTMGDASAAIEVVDHALNMPLDPATDVLRILGAAAEVLRDDPTAALSRLAPVSPHTLTPYYVSLYMLLRTASQLAAALEENASWRESWKTWCTALQEHGHSFTDNLFRCLTSQSQLMLVRRQGNFLRYWFAEFLGKRQLARMRKRALRSAN